MSWRDIRAILWLRWRLGTNRMARSGVVGRVLAVVVTALVGLTVIVAFTVPVTVGSLVLDRARQLLRTRRA